MLQFVSNLLTKKVGNLPTNWRDNYHGLIFYALYP